MQMQEKDIEDIFLKIFVYVDSPYKLLPLATIRRLLAVFNSLN